MICDELHVIDKVEEDDVSDGDELQEEMIFSVMSYMSLMRWRRMMFLRRR